MKTSLPCRSLRSSLKIIGLIFLATVCGSVGTTQAANARPPVLLSDSASTRAIALESVTLKAEPFAPTSLFSSDTRNRICIFAMSLDLLPGKVLTPSAQMLRTQPASLYPLKIEYTDRSPDFRYHNVHRAVG